MNSIIYFASIREQLGIEKETIKISFATLDELRQYLSKRGHDWQRILYDKETKVSQNHHITQWQAAIDKNSEIAIFPPMTGG